MASLEWIVGISHDVRRWIFRATHWCAKHAVPILSSLDNRPRAAMTITDFSTRARFFSSSAGPRCLLRRVSPRYGPNMSSWPRRIPARRSPNQ